MKGMKRLLALLLCVVMVVGLIPASVMGVFAAETTNTGAVEDAAIVFSDLHTSSSDYKESHIKKVMTALKNSGKPFSSVISAGDAFSVNSGTGYTGYTSKITGAIQSVLGNIPVEYVWSDHDRCAVLEDDTTKLPKDSGFVYGAGADGTLGTDDDGKYYVFALSMADTSTNDRYNAGLYSTTEVQSHIATFTAQAAKLKQDRPLLVVAHQPLLDRRNDNGHALLWCNAINTVADSMDVVYFFGHNHKYDEASDYYYAKGSTMSVCNSSSGGATSVELKFTHVCTGYLEPTSTGSYSSSGTRKNTAMAVTIYENAIGLTTYDTAGVYTGSYALDVAITRDHKGTAAPTVTGLTVSGQEEYAVGEGFQVPTITATYSDGTTKALSQEECTVSGSFDMEQAGNYQVTYTYEGQSAVYSFKVVATETPEPSVPETDPTEPETDPTEPETDPTEPEDENVTLSDSHGITVTAPHISNLQAEELSADAVKAAVEELMTTYKAYDIVIAGYTDGDTAYVTLPIPAGVTDPVVYHVDGNTATIMPITNIDWENRTVTFVTNHFSTYVVGQRAASDITLDSQNATVEGSTSTVTKTYYVLTNTIEAGESYLIATSNTASNTTRYLLSNNNNNPGRTEVTIKSGNIDGRTGNETYIELDNATNALWTVGGSYTFRNNNRYLRYNNSLSLSTTSTTWSYTNNYLKVSNQNRYLRYNNGWTTGNNTNNATRVYFYVPTEVEETVTVPGHTYSVSAANVAASALSGSAVTLNARLYDKPTNGNQTDITTSSGLTPTYTVVTTKGDPSVITEIRNGRAILSGVVGTAVVRATYTDGTLTAYTEFLVTANKPNYAISIDGSETIYNNSVEDKKPIDLNATVTVDGANYTADVTWSVGEDPNGVIAGVDQYGTVTYTGNEGTATIIASYTGHGDTYTDTVTIVAKKSNYDFNLAAESDTVTIKGTLDVAANTLKNGSVMAGQTVTWTSSDNTIATVDATGKVTGVGEGKVTITATWTDPTNVVHEASIDLNVVQAVWYLDLGAPVYDAQGNKVYATDENGNQLLDDENQPYYATTPITKPIVIKDVVAGQTYSDVWASITCDGVNLGNLSEEELKNLYFQSSHTGIATIDASGKVTFTGAKGTVAITAIYTYAEGKSVSDTVIFSVSPDHYYVPEDGTDDFPEYPNEGAIRFDKTATSVGTFSETGITQMELSMTGVPFTKGAQLDVVLMLDHSNSMTDTRMAATREAVEVFLNNITKNADGEFTGNRIYIGSFAGGNPQYAGQSNHEFRINLMTTDEEDGYQIVDDQAELDALIATVNRVFVKPTNPPYGTEYAQSLERCYEILQASKADGNKQFCVFMSDGIPNVYQYGPNAADQTTSSSAMAQMFTGTNYNTRDTDYKYEYYSTLMKSEGVTVFTVGLGLYGTNSSLSGATATECEHVANILLNDISGPAYETEIDTGTTVSKMDEYFFSVADSNAAAGMANVFENIAKKIVDAAKDVKVVDTMGEMYTMVFDIPNDSVAGSLAGTGYSYNDPFYIEVKDYPLIPVDENGNVLPEGSENIADFLRDTAKAKSLIKLYMGKNADGSYYAASDAEGTKFAEPVFTTNPVGTKLYWTTTDNGSTTKLTVGDTTYYFVEEGNGTHNMASGAYASGTPVTTKETRKITEDGVEEIVEFDHTVCNDVVIATPYFAYNAVTKKLVWTTEKLATSELAMTYFLYLKNSGGFAGAPNETKPDTYKTNEAAYLYYKNFNNVECEQEFPVPQMTWNGAQISYVFYLVNEQGLPVNRAGKVVPFSEAVYVTSVETFAITWNRMEQSAGLEAVRLAEELVPDVYKLFDQEAAYRIHVYENEEYVNLNNHFVIESGTAINTTYVFNTKADNNKYKVPGTYVADNGVEPTSQANQPYRCKGEGTISGVRIETIENMEEATFYVRQEAGIVFYIMEQGKYLRAVEWEEGATYYELTGAPTYTAAAGETQWTPKDSDKFTGGSKLGNHVYYLEPNGDIYTIVDKSNGTEVHKGFDFANTTVAFAVVWKPELVEDTIVVDFGLDVVVDVITNDAMAAGVVGVRADKPNAEINKGIYSAAKNISADINVDGLKIGTATVENLTSVRFSLDKKNGMQFNQPVVFYYETDVNYYIDDVLQTTSMYSSVTVIPATTIYYEDSFVTFSDNWSVEGTTSNKTQAVDRPGENKLSATYDADNVYGYDAAYGTYSTYSLGSARKVHVDASSYGTATFTFWGTGFDVIGMTSNTTGVITAVVKDANGNKAASKVVNTYYGYGYGPHKTTYTYMQTVAATEDTPAVYGWVETAHEPAEMPENYTVPEKPVNPTVGETTYEVYYADGWYEMTTTDNSLYQVPVLQIEGLDYGKYTVTLTATYAKAFDKTGNNGYDLYLDAIRIYDPTGVIAGEDKNDTDGVVSDAYIADGESDPIYTELRNNVIAASNYTVTEDEDGNQVVSGDAINGVVFIDGKNEVNTITDYVSYGPNNELYLANGQAIAFNVADAATFKDIQLGIKSADGGAVTYSINGDSYTVSTATDMYYSIAEYAKAGTVIIKNVSGGILSLTNIKVTAAIEADAANLLWVDGETATFALRFLSRAPVDEDTDTGENEGDDTTTDDNTNTDTGNTGNNGNVDAEKDETVSGETVAPEVNDSVNDAPATDAPAEEKTEEELPKEEISEETPEEEIPEDTLTTGPVTEQLGFWARLWNAIKNAFNRLFTSLGF